MTTKEPKQTTTLIDALTITQKTLKKKLTSTKNDLEKMKQLISVTTVNPNRQTIKVEANPNELSPEEIFDILKNKNGWFGSEWGEPVVLKWDEPEPDERMQTRINQKTDLYDRYMTTYKNLKIEHQELEQQLSEVKLALKAEYAKLHASN